MKRLLYTILLLFCFASAAIAEDVWVDESWQHVNAEYDCGDLSLVIDADIMDISEGTSVREYHAEYLSDDFIIRKGQESDWSLLGIDTSRGAWRLPTKDYQEYDFTPDSGTVYPSISLSTLHLRVTAFNSYYIYLDDAHWTYDISPISVDGLTEQQFSEYVENVASICGYQVGNMVQFQQVNDVGAVRNLISAANRASSAEYKPDADKAAEYLFAQAYYPVYYNGLRLYSGTYSAAEDGMEIPPLNLRIAVTSGHGLAFCSSVLLDLSDLAPIGDEQSAITARDVISIMADYYNNTSKPGTERITVKQIALEYVPKTGEKASDQGFTLYPAWVVRYELETEQGERISLYQGYHAATGESLFVR